MVSFKLTNIEVYSYTLKSFVNHKVHVFNPTSAPSPGAYFVARVNPKIYDLSWFQANFLQYVIRAVILNLACKLYEMIWIDGRFVCGCVCVCVWFITSKYDGALTEVHGQQLENEYNNYSCWLLQIYPDPGTRKNLEKLSCRCPNDICTWTGILKEYEVSNNFKDL